MIAPRVKYRTCKPMPTECVETIFIALSFIQEMEKSMSNNFSFVTSSLEWKNNYFSHTYTILILA